MRREQRLRSARPVRSLENRGCDLSTLPTTQVSLRGPAAVSKRPPRLEMRTWRLGKGLDDKLSLSSVDLLAASCFRGLSRTRVWRLRRLCTIAPTE